MITRANAKSKSEKFPPPHEDGAVGFPLGSSRHLDATFVPPDVPFSTTLFSYSKEPTRTWSGPLANSASVGNPRQRKNTAGDPFDPLKPPSGTVRGKSDISRVKGNKSIV